MTLWWQALVLLCCVLNCVDSSSPSPLLQRNKYNNSFRLTRSTRTRVQQLQRKYKEQQLGNKHFEDRSRQLKDLPLLSTDFYGWLSLTDWERLHAAFWDMQAYWNMLEWKRKQLEKEEKEQMVARAVGTTLPQHQAHSAGPEGPDEPSQQSDELHEELLDEANLSYGTHKPTDQIQNSMGQPSGGLHHSEGSRPLPHQAGKRLPPPGFKNTLMTQR